jgi:acetyl-CoA carboxylase beta subunit
MPTTASIRLVLFDLSRQPKVFVVIDPTTGSVSASLTPGSFTSLCYVKPAFGS